MKDHYWLLVAMGVVLSAISLKIAQGLLQGDLHDAAERSAGSRVIEGPKTANGQVFYLTDGIRQVWCPDGGDFMDCKWLENRRPCP